MSARRKGFRRLAVTVCCAVSLAFATCGGDDESTDGAVGASGATGDSGSAEAGGSSDASTEDRLREALAQGGVTGTQADCMVDGLEDALTEDQLQQAADTFDSTGENTQEFDDAAATVGGDCDLGAESP